MKLSYEELINFLINANKQKNCHKDFQVQNQLKINIINDILFDGEQLISFENKEFSFKTNKDIERYNKSYIEYTINQSLDKCNLILRIGDDELTTSKEIFKYKNKINLHSNNSIISSHQDAIKKVYIDVIKNSIETLFFVSFMEKKKGAEKQLFNINKEFTEPQLKEWNKELCELDYL